MSRRKTIISTIVVLAVVVVLATRHEQVYRGEAPYLVMNKLDAGDGRSIWILFADQWFEISSWSYEIHENGRTIVPTTHLWSCCDADYNFEIVSSCDKTVIGLVRPSRPGVLHVVHDFATGATWPRGDDRDAAIKMRDILQADNPQLKLTLKGDQP